MSEHEETHDESGATPFATFDDLKAKPRRELVFDVTLSDAEGHPVKRKMKFKALGGPAYDDLVAEHPPTPKQLAAAGGSGVAFNIDTFAPALIAAVSDTPRLTYEQAEQLWKSESWSGGESSTLFWNAQRVCNSGLDVPFSERG